MKNTIISIVALVVALSALVSVLPKNKILGAGVTVPAQPTFATSTSVTVTTSSTLVQSTTTRTYALISNGGPQSVWLAFLGDNAAVINKGVLLTASSTYEISIQKGNAYYGSIYGIAAGTASSIITVTGY